MDKAILIHLHLYLFLLFLWLFYFVLLLFCFIWGVTEVFILIKVFMSVLTNYNLYVLPRLLICLD